MTSRFMIYAAVTLSMTGTAVAAELEPGRGVSVHLAAYAGVVYYTVEPDGFRVVATLASGPDALPIRMISTLLAGQSLLLSVPQSVGQPPIDFEIAREANTLVVSGADPAATVDQEEMPISETSKR